MTNEGIKMVAALLPHLQKLLPGGKPSQVHAGTGRRQWVVANVLGFASFASGGVFYSALWGDASTATGSGAIKDVMLGHGLVIAWDHYLSPKHMETAIQVAIRELPDNAVICSGRPVLVRLKALEPEQCQSGALYALHVADDGKITVELLVSGAKLLDGSHGAQI